MNEKALKILSVDDEPDLALLIRQMFRKEIKSGEFEFYFASNGMEALEILSKNEDISVVLADINMPVMNGLTLLKRIKELGNPLIRVLMVSAYGDMKNIRTAMNNGAFDFVTKPIDFSDLKATILKCKEDIDFLRRKIEQGKQLKVLEADIEAGALIQAALLPEIKGGLEAFPQVGIYTHYSPAKEVSGDFYDVFSPVDGKLGFLVADVSGKGIPAAAFMLICHTAIRVYSREELSPAAVLQKTNDFVNIDNGEAMFVTAFLCLLDARTGELTYSFAGHNKPFLVSGGEVKVLEGEQNIALGIVDDFHYVQRRIAMQNGDKLLLFTDGLTEAVDAQDNEFGEERVTEILKRTADLSIDRTCELLLKEVAAFTGDLPRFDDLTVVGIQFGK